jgi:hypothetical protein
MKQDPGTCNIVNNIILVVQKEIKILICMRSRIGSFDASFYDALYGWLVRHQGSLLTGI